MKKKNNISLDEIGNKLPFSVPENYFDEFSMSMDNQIGVMKSVPMKRLLKPWMYMAAMFIGIFFIGQIFYSIYQNKIDNNTEMYDLYVMTQVDETLLWDFYLSDVEDNTDYNH